MNNYYEIVRNDPTIINIYNEIKEYEEAENGEWIKRPIITKIQH